MLKKRLAPLRHNRSLVEVHARWVRDPLLTAGEANFDRKREARFEQFLRTQRCRRRWISFHDIADWCSKDGQSPVPDAEKRTVVLEALRDDFWTGDFEENGRSLVLFLGPYSKPKRVTGAWLQEVIECNYDGDHGRTAYLPFFGYRAVCSNTGFQDIPWKRQVGSGKIRLLSKLRPAFSRRQAWCLANV